MASVRPIWLNPNKTLNFYELGGRDPKAHIQPIVPKNKKDPRATIGPIVHDIKPKPKPLSALEKYLAGDSAYQQTLRGNKRTLADFLSDLARRSGEAKTQYGKTRSSMKRDSRDQLHDLAEEWASRGLIQSGLYAKAKGDFQTKFGEQMSALDQQQAALRADLIAQGRNFRRENTLSNEAARQEALLRRAQQYKVGGK